ncbi:MAG: His/Gly/Thr/Pro-type tRNA ligase C-terminal domain-containing protein [Patescibacteria group bacterium]|nr:His/Gly/Thr/Pro-type tRNA ligase C-terminal domain-containing protein [Patescibacteria group bacterium]
MLQSKLFTKVTKEAPKDEVSFNAQVLIRAGFIDKLSAGVYSFLPLGLRVLQKISDIIREEMDKIGGEEILMPVLIPKENMETTGRWEAFDVLFKLKGADEKEYALGATHEEVIVPLAKKFLFSYRDLPIMPYQIQTKFRNELRAKSGIMRGREFSMKDLYSFHADQADLDKFYEVAKHAYFKIFDRFGLGDITYLTYASGGSFAKYSHEFQTLCAAGEDIIYICDNCRVAINREIIAEQTQCPICGGKKFREAKAVEVGNIFKLANRFSSPFGLQYVDKNGEKKDVVMGCFGIGPSRAMGTVVEICHDERGIIWPEEIAPFKVHLILLGNKASWGNNKKEADQLYEKLQEQGVEVLYDEREEAGAGEKFAEADLIGCPIRLVISDKTLAEGAVEVKKRNSDQVKLIKLDSPVKDFLA